MSLSVQAFKLGLVTHAMGGFDEEKAYKVTGLDKKDYTAISAFVIGYKGDVSKLPEELKAKEVS